MSDLSSPPPSEDEASIKRKITLTRNQVLFYMNQSVDVFPINTAGNLVKHNTLRHFLFSLAEKAPSQMMNLLEKTRKHALEALEKKKKVEKKEPVQIARKREAPVQEGLMQRIKRLKGDGADGRAEREFSRGMPSSSRYRGLHTGDAPPPYTASAGPRDEDCDSSDDGVESALGEEGHGEEERDEGDDDNDDNNDEESDAGNQGEEAQKALDEEQLQGERQASEETEEIQQVKRSNRPIRQEMLQLLGPRGKSTYNLKPQEMQLHQQAFRIMKSMATRQEMECRMELGLTRGEQWALRLIRRNSRILKNPVTNVVFDFCKKLDFSNIQMSLVQFHQDQRDQIGSKKLKAPISCPCGIDNPYDIYDVLQEYGATTDVLRIFRAYGQLRLWDSVNQIMSKGKETDHSKILDKLALSKSSHLSNEKKGDRKKKFVSEYHAGARWQDVATVFGGEEVVMVFVSAKIGSQMIAKSLIQDQREALGELSYYLKGAKKLVTCLGSGSLEYFCRHRYLPKKTISDLQKLEPDSHEELGSNGRVETDDDDDN